MRKEERLWRAIGGADPALLERSERRETGRRARRLAGGMGLAACLALILISAAVLRGPGTGTPPVSPEDPPGPGVTEPPAPGPAEPGSILAEEDGAPHLLLCGQETGTRPAFLLYINEEHYSGAWEGSAYVIRPRVSPPEGMPECSLTVERRADCALEEARAAEEARLAEAYAEVLEPEFPAAGRIRLFACDSADWDAANAAVTLVEDGAGGVYVLTARFFTEAAEGLGAWFADMTASFTPLPAAEAVPAWMTRLEETVGALTAAAFSGRWTPEARALLAEGAQVSGYEEDLRGEISIAGTDLTLRGGEPPASATASVRHRLSSEEPYDYLTIELAYEAGQWRAGFVGLER